ncbi:hypothetical protein [Oscillatoria sp. HE19RPO]|uniref:hypothetical protein n=1 Tax=Oscillatoria sp. HE19RPO TaxID=2954806 RepID=UPI0020C59811|nr:hypothetical protein [Oscillatoria sp. HE19RPO]
MLLRSVPNVCMAIAMLPMEDSDQRHRSEFPGGQLGEWAESLTPIPQLIDSAIAPHFC